MAKKKTIDDILNDDEFGMLESKPKTSHVKSEDDRLVDSFEEINTFYQKHEREPSSSNMSEYSLLARLKNFRSNEDLKIKLKPYDKYNLLGQVDLPKPSIDDVLNEIDELDLGAEEDLSIFKFKHVPNDYDRAEADFVAQRKPMKNQEFEKYEKLFHKVHQELKDGVRKLKPFRNAEKNLKEGNFYLMDGILLYLEKADLKREVWEQKSGNRVRLEGRTKTIFENGTYSNMLFRSLGKQIIKNGKLVTQPTDMSLNELFVDEQKIKPEDERTGWIYVLKSKSTNPEIAGIKDLYKIGFSSQPVDERIKNASKESTYLYAEVKKVATYSCYNRNADKLEALLHRLFATACLDIDLFDPKGRRLNPREWFVVPFEVIEEAVQLIMNETIVNYEYDAKEKKLRLISK